MFWFKRLITALSNKIQYSSARRNVVLCAAVLCCSVRNDTRHNSSELYHNESKQFVSFNITELTSSTLSDPKCKFLVFMSCTHYMPPDEIDVKQITKYVKAHTALGGGQLGLFGTAGLHTWAKDVDELVKCFTDNREIDRRKLFDDSAGRW